jgi:hypothetical protein
MKAQTKVRLTKLQEHNPGELPVEYWLEGTLHKDIIIGEPIYVNRQRRSAREPGEVGPQNILGYYTSSNVVSFDGKKAVTQNSVWLIDIIP